jgi:hypothetical protein
MSAWRKQRLVSVGSYFFHRDSIFWAHFRPFSAFWEATLLAKKISRKATKVQMKEEVLSNNNHAAGFSSSSPLRLCGFA